MSSVTGCNVAQKLYKTVVMRITDTTQQLSDMTGLNAAKIVTDFSNVYSKASANTKKDMEAVFGFKQAATEDINDMVSMLTNGAVPSLDKLKDVTDPFIVNAVLGNISQMTKAIIRNSGSQQAMFDSINSMEYRGMFKGAQWANAMGMAQQKFTSGWLFNSMLGEIVEEFDGLFINKDFIMKQNLGIDAARGEYVDAYKKIETNTPKLQRTFNRIISNEKALKGGLTVDAINKLMKNFDQDIDDKQHSQMRQNIEDMIQNGKLELKEGEQIGQAVQRYSKLMELVYDDWKMFNYGTMDTNPKFFEDYYKNWENYRGSYLNHIISGGVDFVKTVMNGLRTKSMTKEVLSTMSDQEKSIMELFAKYAFKGDEALEAEYKELTGMNVETSKTFYPRKDYIPYLMNDSTKSMFESGKGKDIPFAQMLESRREDRLRGDISDTNLVDNFVTDIESYRAMMTKAHGILFARRINDKILNDADYRDWKTNHQFEHAVIAKYANMELSNLSSERVQSSKYVELFRQTMIALLGLQNAVTLMGSGPKNLIQGLSSLGMHKNLTDVRDMYAGKLSIKHAKDSIETIGDSTFGDVANRTDLILNNLISGRRAEVKLYDAMTEGLEGKYAKILQGVFTFVENSNQYGMLAPFASVLPKTLLDSVAEGSVTKLFTNAGSEMTLRNWRKHEAFNMIGFEFHTDKMMLESAEFKGDKESIKTKWSKHNIDDTIRKIADKYKYDLYEKDNAYFGDFGTDTKPFWSHTLLHDGDTIAKVMLGAILANRYMFLQAGYKGLSDGLMSTAKEVGETIGSKSATINSPVVVPCVVLGALGLDLYNTFFADEYSMNIPLVGALNQMQEVGVATKAIALITAPLFNFNMSKESHDKCIESLSRWGGGMVAGKTLNSIMQDIEKDLTPFTTMLQSNMNYPVHLTKGIYGLVASHTSAEYKESKDYINSAYQLTFPGLDNIFGGNNDVLRMAVNTLAMFGSIGRAEFTNDDDKKKYSEYRNRAIMKWTSDLFGYNIFQVTSGQKMFEKKVADVTDETLLRAFAIEEGINPGTHDLDYIKDATQSLYEGMER